MRITYLVLMGLKRTKCCVAVYHALHYDVEGYVLCYGVVGHDAWCYDAWCYDAMDHDALRYDDLYYDGAMERKEGC